MQSFILHLFKKPVKIESNYSQLTRGQPCLCRCFPKCLLKTQIYISPDLGWLLQQYIPFLQRVLAEKKSNIFSVCQQGMFHKPKSDKIRICLENPKYYLITVQGNKVAFFTSLIYSPKLITRIISLISIQGLSERKRYITFSLRDANQGNDSGN